MKKQDLEKRLEIIEECILDLAYAIESGKKVVYQEIAKKIFNNQGK